MEANERVQNFSQNHRIFQTDVCSKNNCAKPQKLWLSLEDIFYGCIKKLKINKNFGNFESIDDPVTIEIKPGTPEGTLITIPFVRDDYSNFSKLNFIVFYKPHALFTVNGSDLEYSVQKIKSDVKTDFRLSIPTLDNNYFDHLFKNINENNNVIKFPKLGLPIYNTTSERGDLVVRFKILSDDRKDESVEHPFPLSLQEVLLGCSKRMKIKRFVINENNEQREEEKIVTIHISSGTPTGYKFTYPCEGDRKPGRIPADIIFIVTDKPDSVFTRSGCDLIYVEKLSKNEAAEGGTFQIPTLTFRKTHLLTIKKSIENDFQVKIPGKGLPKFFNPKERGNIIVKFEVVSLGNDNCKSLTKQQKLKQNFINSNFDTSSNLSLNSTGSILSELKEEKKALNTKSLMSSKLSAKSAITFQHLPLDLESILFGATLQKVFIQKTFAENEVTILQEKEVTLSINVLPGTEGGTTYYFSEAGNCVTGKTPHDIVFVANDAPHRFFKRHGVDLEYTAEIVSAQTAPGSSLEIPTLGDEKPLVMVINQLITSETVIKLQGYGLPYQQNNNKRGNLIVKFKIVDQMNSPENFFQVFPKFPKDPDIKFELPLSLLDILHGTIKTCPFKRIIFLSDGEEIVEEKVFTIKINPGVPSGSRFRISSKGNKYPNRIPADIVYTTVDKQDLMFIRKGTDIIYTAQVTKEQIKKQNKIEIPNLEGMILIRKVPSSLSSSYKILNRGLPFPDNSKKRGKLIVKFELTASKSTSNHSLLCIN